MHLADRTLRPVRDGGTRHGQMAPIDAQNRVGLGKALSALGWTRDTFLVATRESGHIVVRAAADSALLTRGPPRAAAASRAAGAPPTAADCRLAGDRGSR